MNTLNPETMNIVRKFSNLEERVMATFPQDKLTAKEAVSIYMGLIIGKSLPIPAEPLNHVTDDFNAIYRPKVLDYIGQVNEVYILNIDDVLEISYLVWESRYKTVHSNECNIQEAIELLIQHNSVVQDLEKGEKLNALRSITELSDCFKLPSAVRDGIKESLKV